LTICNGPRITKITSGKIIASGQRKRFWESSILGNGENRKIHGREGAMSDYTDRVIILARIQQAVDVYKGKLKREHPSMRDDFLRGMEAVQHVVEDYYDERE
jgi:hypothetical protein